VAASEMSGSVRPLPSQIRFRSTQISIWRLHEASPPQREGLAIGLTKGSPVRIIREPGFGRLGVVKSLPTGVQSVESEAKVRVVEIQFPDGETAVVPRANVEAIES